MNQQIWINQDRLAYLIQLFGISKSQLLEKINEKRKRVLTEQAIFSENIKLSVLKKIDGLFKQGLSFYTNPQSLSKEKSSSIFFRKDHFNSEMHFADHWRVNEIENKIHSLSAITKLSGYKIERKLKRHTTQDSPEQAAKAISKKIDFQYLYKTKDDKTYLTELINQLAKFDIFVYEFVETWNLKNKTSWQGMFIEPNNIAIKRKQYAFKREIFTLAHELGHYLLNKEEIDENPLISSYDQSDNNLNRIETWCNNFAYYFIVGNEDKNLKQACLDDLWIQNETILALSKKLRISRLAIYTHLACNQDISWAKYHELKDSLGKEYKQKEQERKEQNTLNKQQGKKGGQPPKPIDSPLEKDIFRHAYFEGTIEDIDIIKQFNPSLSKIKNGYIEDFLYEESA